MYVGSQCWERERKRCDILKYLRMLEKRKLQTSLKLFMLRHVCLN